MLVSHIHGRNGKRVATLVATKIDGEIRIGWAVKHPTDTWNRRHGLAIAMSKLMIPHFPIGHMPGIVIEAMPAFLGRCSRYFHVEPQALIGTVIGAGDYVKNKILDAALLLNDEYKRRKAELQNLTALVSLLK